MTEPTERPVRLADLPDDLNLAVCAAYNALLDRTYDLALDVTAAGYRLPHQTEALVRRRGQLVTLAAALFLERTLDRDLATIDAALALPTERIEQVAS